MKGRRMIRILSPQSKIKNLKIKENYNEITM